MSYYKKLEEDPFYTITGTDTNQKQARNQHLERQFQTVQKVYLKSSTKYANSKQQ